MQPARVSGWGSSSAASALAAASIAGLARKPCADSSRASSERISRSRLSSPAQALRRNASRSSGGRSSADWNKSSTCFQRLGSMGPSTGKLPKQPGPGQSPVPFYSDRRNLQDFGCFFHTQTSEVSHLDHLHLARIEPGQLIQGIIERRQIRISPALRYKHGRLFEGNVTKPGAPFHAVLSCVVDQDSPH